MSRSPLISLCRRLRKYELPDQIERVMVEFQQAHPSVTNSEIRQATQLALRSTRGSYARVVPLVLGLVLLLGLMVFYLFAAG